jgi:hypothetical protein
MSASAAAGSIAETTTSNAMYGGKRVWDMKSLPQYHAIDIAYGVDFRRN